MAKQKARAVTMGPDNGKGTGGGITPDTRTRLEYRLGDIEYAVKRVGQKLDESLKSGQTRDTEGKGTGGGIGQSDRTILGEWLGDISRAVQRLREDLDPLVTVDGK